MAFVLCQLDHVLNDGKSANSRSREAVIKGVRIKKVVTQHEDKNDGCSSD